MFLNPFYNSVVATFCHQLVNNQQPRIDNDSQVKLIYVGDLVHQIIELIRLEHNASEYIIQANEVIHVSEILQLLEEFKAVYFLNGGVPNLDSKFKVQLFNTFRSFIDLKEYFPKAFYDYKNNGVTMEAWIYPTASSTGPALFAANASDNNGGSSWGDWWWGLQGYAPSILISNGTANSATY